MKTKTNDPGKPGVKYKSPFPVIGIGASAGGLEALQDLFGALPDKTGMAFIVVQHLSPDYKSMLSEILAKSTEMQVIPAKNNIKIEPDNVYCIEPNTSISIIKGTIKVQPNVSKDTLHLPIDLFLNSLGQDLEDKAIGVILSGTGSDGSRGLKSIRAHGGIVMVQNPETAKFDGMPESAIRTRLVDFVESPVGIAKEILNYHEIVKKAALDKRIADEKEEPIFTQILITVKNYSGIDFLAYKQQTLIRRIEKCMGIRQIATLAEYYDYLGDNPDEIRILYKEFLIGVTEFFRDAEAFKCFEKKVIPRICEYKEPFSTIRIWVTACSTGEEVYSIAMLFEEYLATNKLDLTYKIFATDIDQEALDFASRGTYSANINSEVPRDFLRKYMDKVEESYVIKKRIREKVVFARHNSIGDPPFIKMDLVTCRNMLIYIQPQIQNKLINNFHFSLVPQGFLFLGSSETVPENAVGLNRIDPPQKIYQNTVPFSRSLRGPRSEEENSLLMTLMRSSRGSVDRDTGKPSEVTNYFAQDIIESFGPNCVFVSKNLNVQYFSGNIDRFFKFPTRLGQMSQNILDMVEGPLQAVIRNGVRRAFENPKDSIVQNIASSKIEEQKMYRLEFSKSKSPKLQDLVRIVFEEVEAQTKGKEIRSQMPDFEELNRLDALESELQLTKDELQVTIEKLETTNEELQATNEELLASNEELQSTNEELQSVNEELYSVNAELQSKNFELEETTNDMQNLLNSTEIATIILDEKLKIRRFTPSIKSLFNIEKSDVGRPIGHFTTKLNTEKLDEISKEVLRTIKPQSLQVTPSPQEHYIINFNPFRTDKNSIKGVVITFLDISEMHQMQSENIEVQEKLTSLINSLQDTVILADESGDILYSNRLPLDGIVPKSSVNKIQNVLQPSNSTELLKHFKLAKKDNEPLNFSIETKLKDKQRFYFDAVFYPVSYGDGMVNYYLIMRNVTQLVEAKHSLEFSNMQFSTFMDNSPFHVWIKDEDLKFEYVNTSFCFDRKMKSEEILGKKESTIWKRKESKEKEEIDKKVIDNKEIRSNVNVLRVPGQEQEKFVYEILFFVRRPNGEIGVGGIGIDITEERLREEELKELNEMLQKKNAQLSHFSNIASHNLRAPIANIKALVDLLRDEDVNQEIIKELDVSSYALLNTVNTLSYVMTLRSSAKMDKEIVDIQESLSRIVKVFGHDKDTGDFELDTSNLKVKKIRYPRVYMDSILMNLISNAIKYKKKSKKAKIKVSTYKKKGEVFLELEDNGIGIDLNKFGDKIFKLHQVFHKSDSANGEGLFITKAHIEEMGGEINVQSEVNVGTKFIVNLREDSKE